MFVSGLFQYRKQVVEDFLIFVPLHVPLTKRSLYCKKVYIRKCSRRVCPSFKKCPKRRFGIVGEAEYIRRLTFVYTVHAEKGLARTRTGALVKERQQA